MRLQICLLATFAALAANAQETKYCSAPVSTGTAGSWTNECTGGPWKQFFNPTYGTCCSGGVAWGQINPVADAGCCEGAACNMKTQICCDFGDNPVVYDVPTGVTVGNAECCAGKIIDTTKEKCCKNAVTALSDGCCGSGTLKSDGTELCCQGKVVTKSGSKVCCGTGLYDPATELCCDGTAATLKDTADASNNKCCGTAVYKVDTEICCFENGSPAVKDTTATPAPTCCGAGAAGSFDPATQKCCEGSAVTSPTTIDANNRECCGAAVIDKSAKLCCNNAETALPTGITSAADAKCCAAASYDPTADLCCSDKVATKDGADISTNECCGEVAIDAATKKCCKGAGVLLTDTSNMCCGTGDLTATQKCCSGTPTELPTGKTAAESKCCDVNGVQTAIDASAIATPADRGCCGATVIDLATKICCEGAEVDAAAITPATNRECCGSTVIDKTAKLCCDVSGTKTGVDKKSATVDLDKCCPDGTVKAKTDTC